MKESVSWLKVAKSTHYGAVARRTEERLCAPGLCDAVVDLVLSSGRYEMWYRMHNVYKPDVPRGSTFWWGVPGRNERNDNARVLAALFLRELALDEERGKR